MIPDPNLIHHLKKTVAVKMTKPTMKIVINMETLLPFNQSNKKIKVTTRIIK